MMDEVIPIVLIGFLICGALGIIEPQRAWLRGVGFGLGTRLSAILPSVSPPPGHVERYGESQPLPLPFGLTSSSIAQYFAGSLIFILVPIIIACVAGALARTVRDGA